jgi:Ni,Fe-hydrogenase maturation factor
MDLTAFVAAIGDPHGGKDAVGPLLLEELLRSGIPSCVRTHFLGRRPDRLPDVVAQAVGPSGRAHLVMILDAVTCSTEDPGLIVERELRAGESVRPLVSSHIRTVPEAVDLLHVMLGNRAPSRLILVGVTVGPDCSGPLPDVVKQALPAAAERARQIILGCLSTDNSQPRRHE